jgi:NAD-dependent dihydropyrimidine dehydrogenase PreA subunit
MIELVLADACTACGACIPVCPTNVFDRDARGGPIIARQDDCQTCFICELYCPVDALYVAPDCEAPTPGLDPARLSAAGLIGQYRRDSGWGEWADRHANEHWRMEEIFARARSMPAREPVG